MERRRIPISLTLDPATIEEARGAAAEDGRSVSSWIDRTLGAALAPRVHMQAGYLFAAHFPTGGAYSHKQILCGAPSGIANFSDVDSEPFDCPGCLLVAHRLWLAKEHANEAAREAAKAAR